MTKALRVLDYLDHMLQALDRINRYTVDLSEAGFLNNEMVQDAVVRNIEIVGEASNKILRIAPEFAAQHGDIPWLVLYTMRNRLSHGYDKVDQEIVWKTIRGDLPPLRAALSRLRNGSPPSL